MPIFEYAKFAKCGICEKYAKIAKCAQYAKYAKCATFSFSKYYPTSPSVSNKGAKRKDDFQQKVRRLRDSVCAQQPC